MVTGGQLGPFSNFKSIENVNETTITNLADEFLNADFNKNKHTGGPRQEANGLQAHGGFQQYGNQMQSNKHVNPFLSKNNELDQLLGLQQTQQREQIEFYPQSQENVDWQHGQHDQPVAIFEQVPQRSMGEQRRQPEPSGVES